MEGFLWAWPFGMCYNPLEGGKMRPREGCIMRMENFYGILETQPQKEGCFGDGPGDLRAHLGTEGPLPSLPVLGRVYKAELRWDLPPPSLGAQSPKLSREPSPAGLGPLVNGGATTSISSHRPQPLAEALRWTHTIPSSNSYTFLEARLRLGCLLFQEALPDDHQSSPLPSGGSRVLSSHL